MTRHAIGAWASAVLLSGVVSKTTLAQGVVPTGRQILVITVWDSATGRLLPDVTVSAREHPARSRSDSAGRAVVEVRRAPTYVLEGQRLGYRSAKLEVVGAGSGDTTEVALSLVPTVRALEEVIVPGAPSDVVPRLAPFERRRLKNAGGSFITRADFQKWNTTRLTDALRRLPGVRIVDSGYVKFVASSRSGKPRRLLFGELDYVPCIMRVGIDGEIKEAAFQLDEFPVGEIHGVEVYPGPASIPAEFGGLRKDAFCGLVMIWTRAA